MSADSTIERSLDSCWQGQTGRRRYQRSRHPATEYSPDNSARVTGKEALPVTLSSPGLSGLRVRVFGQAAAGHASTVSVVVTGAVPSALTVRVTVYVPGAP
jgi:hypothetical protein